MLEALEAVLLTHAHADHTGFAERACTEANAPVSVHQADAAVAKGAKPGKNDGSMSRYLLRAEFYRSAVSLGYHARAYLQAGRLLKYIHLNAQARWGQVLQPRHCRRGGPGVTEVPGTRRKPGIPDVLHARYRPGTGQDGVRAVPGPISATRAWIRGAPRR